MDIKIRSKFIGSEQIYTYIRGGQLSLVSVKANCSILASRATFKIFAGDRSHVVDVLATPDVEDLGGSVFSLFCRYMTLKHLITFL